MRDTPVVLVTGGAGFIGSSLADRLLENGWRVVALDNFDPFYDDSIKRNNTRHNLLNARYKLVCADIRDRMALKGLNGPFDAIVHLAAKAGVRPSILDPAAYQETNVIGTQQILEFARQRGVKQFVFASSSSVYGVAPDVPWREDTTVLPISPYASTKISGELLGHVYSHLYGIRFVALRFFTVYGPRQRPDLAISRMARLMLGGKPLPVYGAGNSRRDYTYIDDIVSGIVGAIDYRATDYEVINLGGNRPIGLLEMIHMMERVSGKKACLDFRPEEPGDVPQTWADTTKARRLLGYAPSTDFCTGLTRFFEWLDATAAEIRGAATA